MLQTQDKKKEPKIQDKYHLRITLDLAVNPNPVKVEEKPINDVHPIFKPILNKIFPYGGNNDR